MTITHTAGQTAGYNKFAQFYLDPMETVMVLKGHSGTGKSTLVRHVVDQLPKLNKMMGLIDPNFIPYDVVLTATTNQAAEALAIATGMNDTQTIHSKLGLRVHRDYATGKTQLVIRQGAPKAQRCLLIIDEASFIDQLTIQLIFEQVEDCKLLFVGDPAQLLPVISSHMPAFKMDKNCIELTELVRQSEGELRKLCESLRFAVTEGKWPKITLAKDEISWLNQADFEAEAIKRFSVPNGPMTKILCYRNDRVTYYNNLLSEHINGTTVPLVGQRMINNSMVQRGATSIKTNEEVMLESVRVDMEFGIPGYVVSLRAKGGSWFLPESLPLWKARRKQAAQQEDHQAMEIMDTHWVDLRPSFACTINKSQGSTYDTAFIDLNDVSTVRSGDALARYMYVGTSRASREVIYTGDLA